MHLTSTSSRYKGGGSGGTDRARPGVRAARPPQRGAHDRPARRAMACGGTPWVAFEARGGGGPSKVRRGGILPWPAAGAERARARHCSEHGPICYLFELILMIHANTSNGTNNIV
jgi:hypothetical protein